MVQVKGGQEFVVELGRRIARFDWTKVEHDVLKILYESVIAPPSAAGNFDVSRDARTVCHDPIQSVKVECLMGLDSHHSPPSRKSLGRRPALCAPAQAGETTRLSADPRRFSAASTRKSLSDSSRLPVRIGRLDGRTDDRQIAPYLFTITILLRIAQVLVGRLDLGLPTLC